MLLNKYKTKYRLLMGGTDPPPVSVDGFRACESDDVANEYIKKRISSKWIP